jgi:hypothetical protein
VEKEKSKLSSARRKIKWCPRPKERVGMDEKDELAKRWTQGNGETGSKRQSSQRRVFRSTKKARWKLWYAVLLMKVSLIF